MKLRDSWRFGRTSLGSVFTSGTMVSAVSNQVCSQNGKTTFPAPVYPAPPNSDFAQMEHPEGCVLLLGFAPGRQECVHRGGGCVVTGPERK